MNVFRRKSFDESTEDNVPVKKSSNSKKKRKSRKIDASKSCAELLEDHLYSMWCATPLNLELDEEGTLCGFTHSDFHIQFSFPSVDRFFMAILQQAPNSDRTNAVCTEMEVPSGMELTKQIDGNRTKVILLQDVSVASLLFDEEMEETLELFLATAKQLEHELQKGQPGEFYKQNRRRRSSAAARIRSFLMKKRDQYVELSEEQR